MTARRPAAPLRAALSVLLLALVALGLCARAVGPTAWLETRAGYAAICTGEEIVWIPLSALGYDAPPAETEEGRLDKGHCPVGGQIAAILPAPAGPFPWAAPPTPPAPSPAALAPAAAAPRAFHARGPPAVA